jgi:hypothetical protein
LDSLLSELLVRDSEEHVLFLPTIPAEFKAVSFRVTF